MENFIQNTIACLKSSKWFITAALLLICMTSYAQLPWLHVEGNQIKDESGNDVTLRGVSILPPEHNNECNTCNKKPIAEMLTWTADASQGWHSRVVRLQVTTAKVRDPKESFETIIDPYVQMATEKGLYVIVDLHFVSDYGPGGISQDYVMDFWNYVAPKYAGNSHVIFEVFNEPILPDNWTTWRDFIQPVVTAIRAVAPNNLILVGGPSWSTSVNDAASDPLVGTDLVYVYHIYPNQGAATASNLNNLFGNAAQSIPVMITEFGWNQSSSYSDGVTNGTTTGWGSLFRDFMDAHPHISWTSYIFDNYYKPQFFDESWNLMGGENQGQFMQQWLSDMKDDHQPEPVELTAFGVTSSQINLKWSASAGATSFNVKRATSSGGPYTVVDQVTATGFSDTGLSGETTYYYVISENTPTGEGANSTEVSVTTPVPGFAPDVPIRVKANGGNGSITVTWTGSAGAASYQVARSTQSGGPYTTVATGLTTTSYADTDVVNGTQYFYTVTAVGSVESVPSSEGTDIASDVVAIVDNASATTAGNWTASSGSPGYYGSNYLHDGNSGSTGGKKAIFTPTIPEDGNYLVSLHWTAAANRASNVPVKINHAGGTTTLEVNQQFRGAQWVALGTYAFTSGQANSLEITNDGTDGYVIADAVKFSLSTGSLSNQSPQPAFTYSKTLLNVSVDGSGSTDPDGSIVSYSWDFGDGSHASGATADHTYASSGHYTISLTVTDDGGISQVSSQSIIVSDGTNEIPVAAFTFLKQGKTVEFDASESTDPDGAIISYAWDFGDGHTASGVNVTHTFPNGGDYTVQLTVTDDSTAVASDTQELSIEEAITTTVTINQQQNGGVMNVLGTFPFEPGTQGWVKIRTDGTNGYVVADVVKFSMPGQADIIIEAEDLTAPEVAGSWSMSSTAPGYSGTGYLHDSNEGKGTKSVMFVPDLPLGGEWTVSMQWTKDPNRATNIPVDIFHATEFVPTKMHVQKLFRSAYHAKSGFKGGVARIKVLDDEDIPVSGVIVTGTFSGDFNETKTGITDAEGIVVLGTTGLKRGRLSFDFCVDDVSLPGNVYDEESNFITCTGMSSQRVSEGVEEEWTGYGIGIFPNPTVDHTFTIRLDDFTDQTYVSISDLQGRELLRQKVRDNNTIIELEEAASGIHIVRIEQDGRRVASEKIIISKN